MQTHLFECSIVSMEQELFSGEVESFVVLTENGEIGVYANHAPLLAKLVPSSLKLKMQDGHEEAFFIKGGFIEVSQGKAKILASEVMRTEEIDAERELRSSENAKQAMLEHQVGSQDYQDAIEVAAVAAAKIRSVELMRHLKQVKK